MSNCFLKGHLSVRKQYEWSVVKLNELGFVGRGKSRHRPRNDPSLYGGPYPFIQTADIMASDLYEVDPIVWTKYCLSLDGEAG